MSLKINMQWKNLKEITNKKENEKVAHGQKKQNKYQERKKRNNYNSEWEEHTPRHNAGSAKKRSQKLNTRNYESFVEDEDD